MVIVRGMDQQGHHKVKEQGLDVLVTPDVDENPRKKKQLKSLVVEFALSVSETSRAALMMQHRALNSSTRPSSDR